MVYALKNKLLTSKHGGKQFGLSSYVVSAYLLLFLKIMIFRLAVLASDGNTHRDDWHRSHFVLLVVCRLN